MPNPIGWIIFKTFPLKYTFVFISINKHVATKGYSASQIKTTFGLKKKSSVCFLFYAEKEIGNKELFVVLLIFGVMVKEEKYAFSK